MLASTLTALLALACTAAAHPDSAQVAASVRALGSAFEPYADRFADNGVDGAILVEYSPAGAAGSITDLLSELDIQKPLHRQVLAKHLQNLVHAVNETALYCGIVQMARALPVCCRLMSLWHGMDNVFQNYDL